MSEWWTYRLSDFLMFAPRTYYRLFELYNAETWPAPLLAIVAGFAVVGLAWRGTHGRVVAGIFAVAWLFVAWAYHWERYAAINTAAPYYAAGFAAEGLLLLWFGLVRDELRPAFRRHSRGRVGVAMLIAAIVVLYPLLAALLGRPWTQAEIFGLAPDPTAIATLGVLLLASGRTGWLLPLPLAWCAICAATLWTMDAAEAVLPAAAGVSALATSLGRANLLKIHGLDKSRTPTESE
jgi:hypothetical protein